MLARGITSEPGSYISYEQYKLIRSRPEIVTEGSVALASPEAVTGFFATPDRPNLNFAFLRGVYPEAYRVHRNMRIESGRWPRSGRQRNGRRPQAAGACTRAQARAPSSDFGRRTWTVVGAFSDHDSARESEIWTDLDVLRQDMGFPNGGFASIHVVLKPGMEDAFKMRSTTTRGCGSMRRPRPSFTRKHPSSRTNCADSDL